MSQLAAFALLLPLLMLLLCFSAPVRRVMPALLWLAPLPALVLAVFASSDLTWSVGNSSFALHFALDWPARILLGVGALLWSLAALYNYSLRQGDVSSGTTITWLMALGGFVGVAQSADLVGFYLWLALLSFGASGMVLQGRGEDARRAAGMYLGVALLAEAFVLIALVLMAKATPGGSLLITDAVRALPQATQRDLILGLLVLGLGIKAGMVPMHFWMPLAYAAAPLPAAAVMSGAVIKASVLGLIRLLPPETALTDLGSALATVGLLGTFYGVFVGLTQRNAKHVLAYSSVSQMGFMLAVLGTGMMTGAADLGLIVAFYAAHHVLVKGGLFLAVGLMPQAASRQRGWILIPAAVIGLGLGGLALTGGLLAKEVTKGVMGDGLAGHLALLSSLTSTLLMLHFVRQLASMKASTTPSSLPAGMLAAWLSCALAALLVPWALYAAVFSSPLSALLSIKALWSGLWPLVAGLMLFALAAQLALKIPHIPAGDVAVSLSPLGRIYAALGHACVKLDDQVRRWLLASVLLLALGLTFIALMTGT